MRNRKDQLLLPENDWDLTTPRVEFVLSLLSLAIIFAALGALFWFVYGVGR